MPIQFQNNSVQVKEAVKLAAQRALEASGLLLEGAVKANAPEGETKQLKNTITHQVDEDNLEVRIGSPLDYSIYVEYGTGEFAENGAGRKGGWVYKAEDGNFYFTYGEKPRKFMRNAFRANIDNVKQVIAKEFKEN